MAFKKIIIKFGASFDILFVKMYNDRDSKRDKKIQRIVTLLVSRQNIVWTIEIFIFFFIA